MSQTPISSLVELTFEQIVGFNKRTILDSILKDPSSQEFHAVVKPNDLHSLLAGVFYRDSQGTYLNLPIEKLAALLLYRVAQVQCFANGNKRTALLTCYFFIFNNGFLLRIDRAKVNNLLWGFAKDMDNPLAGPRYNVDDAQRYVEENLSIRL